MAEMHLPDPATLEAVADERCETCKFFKRRDDMGGFCCRLPPVWIDNESNWCFPWMEPKQWCGEFRTRASDLRKAGTEPFYEALERVADHGESRGARGDEAGRRGEAVRPTGDGLRAADLVAPQDGASPQAPPFVIKRTGDGATQYFRALGDGITDDIRGAFHYSTRAEAERYCPTNNGGFKFEVVPSNPGETTGDGWQPIETAPKDGTRVLATGAGMIVHVAVPRELLERVCYPADWETLRPILAELRSLLTKGT